MATASLHDNPNAAHQQQCIAVAPSAIVILIAGAIAAWLAAGSTGLLGHPLQHALTWIALGVAVVAAWPQENRDFGAWAILAVGAIFAVSLTASALPAVNVFAVAIMLAAIAQVSRLVTGRVALIGAFAATALGLFRLACDSMPTVWLIADTKGWVIGRLAGWLAGSRLEVGATFSGLDFLVVMMAVYVGWLVCTAPPRRSRAIWAAVAILAGHFVYLVVLARAEDLLAALPKLVLPALSETNHVGVWTWNSGLRSLIPWNVPLLAVLIHGTILAVMLRCAPWIPVIEIDPEKLKKRKEKEEKEEIPGSVLAADLLFRFGPPLLAVALPLLISLGLNDSNLAGKTVVAYEKGYLNWLKPEYDAETDGTFGMLPEFVESLGGKFVKSAALSEQDLAAADVLLLLHPDEPWPKETLDRIWAYVRRGGSLLVVAEPAVHEGRSQSSFNEVLQPTAMQVRFDTAVTRSGNWEQSYEVLAHPAVTGIDDSRNCFGVQLGSSIRTRWPARPVLVGRWGWSDPGSDAVSTGVSSYNAGKQLGDLVLAAEQTLGQGRIFVLGDTSTFHNEMLADTYPFAGRLLGYLANKPSSPQDVLRQLLGLAALAALIALLALRPAAWQLMLTSAAISASLLCCTAAGHWSGRVLPDGRSHPSGGFNNVAYIDASHLEAYSSDSDTKLGIANLLRTLMRHNYLPLLAHDLTQERIERAGLLISIAPARGFSAAEREAVESCLGAGGTFICMVGAEQARAAAPLLAHFNFCVVPSPVPPGENVREPDPLGAVFGRTVEGNWQARFYAAWGVESLDTEAQKMVYWNKDTREWFIAWSRAWAGGNVIVIGDTNFASNENFEMNGNVPTRFWRWLLSRVTPGQKEWNPPPGTEDIGPNGDGSSEEMTNGN
jgi:hypothetical protein